LYKRQDNYKNYDNNNDNNDNNDNDNDNDININININHQPSSIIHHLPSIIHHSSSIINIICHHPSSINHNVHQLLALKRCAARGAWSCPDFGVHSDRWHALRITSGT
jgi:hypothetical protein